MDLTFTQYVLIFIVFTLAGTTQGISGFGFGLVAVSLLGSILPLKQASIMLVLASLSMNLFIIFRLRQHFSLDRIKWMLVGTVLGVPFGVWLLVYADELLLRQILGILLLATVAQRFVPFIKSKRWHPTWVGLPCGIFSGALSGAFATGGPPAVAYVQSQKLDRFCYSASVQVPLAVGAIVRVICLGANNMFSSQLIILSLMGVICAISGAWVGLIILTHLSDKRVRYIVMTMLLILGFKYLLWS